YDSYGRPTTTYNGALFNNAGVATTTQYTMTNGVLTSQTMTNPAGQAATVTLDPYRQWPLTSRDTNGIVSTAKYDALGRLIKVWKHNRATTLAPDIAYAYTLGTASTATVTTTTALNDASGTVVSTALYDGFLRPVEAQTPT